MKIFYRLLLIFFVFLLFGFDNVEPADFDVKINKLPNALELNWNDISGAEKYLIFRNGEEIYNSTKSHFIHTNLEDGDYVEYDLVAVKGDRAVILHNEIKTSVIHPKYKSKIGIDIISSKDSIKVDWHDLENADSYRISVNENFPTSKKESEIKLVNLKSNTKFEFSIFAQDTSNTTKTENELKGDHYIVMPLTTTNDYTGLNVDEVVLEPTAEASALPEEPVSPPEEPLVLPEEPIEIPGEPSESISEEPLNAISTGSVSTLKHRTFIQPNPFRFTFTNYTVQCGKGDGRSFSPTYGTSRTQVFVSVYWDTRTYGFSKYAYPSTLYNTRCETTSANTKSSSTSGIGLSVKYIYGSEAGFHLTHRAASPHTLYGVQLPSIYYYYDLTMTKSGATYMYGSHDKFPWHEIYRSNNGGTWRQLYTFAPTKGSADAWKLIAPWPNQTINDRNY